MRIIIGQPNLEPGLIQLEKELREYANADILLYPEGYLNQNVEEACRLAATYGTMIVSGHCRLDERPKDRTIIIDQHGQVVMEKAKYTPAVVVKQQDVAISTLLCDEIVLQGFQHDEERVDLLLHSIGVGMFSEEQYNEWLEVARAIAIRNQCMVMGTSHADGSYRDSDTSIPIAYCISSDGEVVFASHNDTRTRVVLVERKGTDEVTTPKQGRFLIKVEGLE
ncbi:hypothetical protein MH215_02595 [Paenibacillus sp. ACRSA]|uniref:hypothetical protein n=1 Tax=Paenibacillus sp. ACRSA TaxID=2918211 RepID=UPI001EF6D84E|nr:hypothetical protein [Paenibacillus sp. ACRSA]MCG7375866.1 hypothetical protein [Paenibacillus sp. ACRSA]